MPPEPSGSSVPPAELFESLALMPVVSASPLVAGSSADVAAGGFGLLNGLDCTVESPPAHAVSDNKRTQNPNLVDPITTT
jgi:hypothetical protein